MDARRVVRNRQRRRKSRGTSQGRERWRFSDARNRFLSSLDGCVHSLCRILTCVVFTTYYTPASGEHLYPALGAGFERFIHVIADESTVCFVGRHDGIYQMHR